MRIGVLFQLEKNIDEEMRKVAELGLHSCQITCWNMDIMTPRKGRRGQGGQRQVRCAVVDVLVRLSG